MADASTRKDTASAEPRTAAEKSVTDPDARDPYPNYDLMSLDELRALAAERGVAINADVEKAHLVTELRAADTATR